MRLGKWLLWLCLAAFSPAIFAQQSGVEIKGTIVEQGSDTPIEQATVRLLSVTDSAMVRGVVSSKNGSFSLKNVKKGNYLLHVTFVGFDPLYQPLQVSGKKNPVNVGKLELNDGSIELGEAVVVGKAPEVSVRNDTIEYNADSYKVTEGSVLEDLLKKMPGVEVDSEGKITVNGKEVKKVMVDGKEFFSDDPKVASKNLPAQMIDKLQVLDKKSDMSMMTGFDDGEEETVINLTVKPGMKQGWFGNAYAGYGTEDRYEANAMVNRFINNDQVTFMGGANNTNNMGFSDMASTMFSGMGGGLVAIGVMQLVKNHKYHANPEYKEQVDTAWQDERNRYLRLKAWSWAGYLFVIGAAVVSIVLFVAGQSAYGQIVSYCMCAVLGLYWITYVILQKKY